MVPWIEGVLPDESGRRSYLETRAYGRILVEPINLADGSVLDTGTMLSDADLARLADDPVIDRIRVRSVLTCEAEHGVCAACYGQSLATGRMIDLRGK